MIEEMRISVDFSTEVIAEGNAKDMGRATDSESI